MESFRNNRNGNNNHNLNISFIVRYERFEKVITIFAHMLYVAFQGERIKSQLIIARIFLRYPKKSLSIP